jgi:catechol 2,3-dioxygenase-like lactoylglutathione lyase family enzyme
MSVRLFDHIDLRVSNIASAAALYDAFLPAVGFGEIKAGGTWSSYSATDAGGAPRPPFVELDELPGHRGGANRIAFWADTEEEVNRVGAIIRAAGAQVVEGPEYCFEYTPGYYAVFFEDADGNKWEVCCRVARVRAASQDRV